MQQRWPTFVHTFQQRSYLGLLQGILDEDRSEARSWTYRIKSRENEQQSSCVPHSSRLD